MCVAVYLTWCYLRWSYLRWSYLRWSYLRWSHNRNDSHRCTSQKLGYDKAKPKSDGATMLASTHASMLVSTQRLNRWLVLAGLKLIPVFAVGMFNQAIAEEMTTHGSHVHGEAQLTFVLDGNEAELALVTAAGNILGFEHSATTPEELQQQKTQLDMLQSGRWFSADAAANCTIAGQEVRTEPDDQGHADVYANIQLLCQAPLKLQNLQFSLFELASGLTTIKAQYLIDGVAGAQELSANTSALKLRN